MTPNEELLRLCEEMEADVERYSTHFTTVRVVREQVLTVVRELRARLEKETRTEEKKGQPE